MYNFYYVNNDQTQNPNLNHEVHTGEHAEQLKIINKTLLGYFDNEIEAVAKAKTIYSDADGCKICCPKSHKG